MKKNYVVPCLLLAALFGMVLSGGCTKPVSVESKWRNHNITISGNDDEWGSATMYVPEAKISVTLFNDSTDMYIRVCSRDRGIQAHVLGMGMTVWFDPGGGKDKSFGIRFPIGRKDIDAPVFAKADTRKPEDFENVIEESNNELEIVYPVLDEYYRMLMSAAETHGISAKLHFTKGNLIYELKIPLVRDEHRQHAIGIAKNDIDAVSAICIGFETPEPDFKAIKKEDGSSTPPQGGGMPPEGNMPPGDMGGMPGGRIAGGGPPGHDMLSEGIDVWLSVNLAQNPQM
jgi:hypothetical protein